MLSEKIDNILYEMLIMMTYYFIIQKKEVNAQLKTSPSITLFLSFDL